MHEVVENTPITYECGGSELAKVLMYYGFIQNVYQGEQKIVCPFHKDLNPSMIINLNEGRFFCFGCGVSGDAYNFVQMLNPHLNDLEAMLKFLKVLKSKRVNKIRLPDRYKEPEEDEYLYAKAQDFYYGLSQPDWTLDNSQEVKEARKYMFKRGFDPKTLNKCKAKVTYQFTYPIVFPMLDNGVFKGWVCRTTNVDTEKKRKYLYNKGFNRLNTLVGDYTGCKYIFVVEGYMDRLKFIQYGITNVVAILGWKMTIPQENKLRESGVEYIISALDNDKCGRRGTKYLKTRFENVIRFCYLKGVKDVGETNYKQFQRMYKKTMEIYKKLVVSHNERKQGG